MIAMEERYVVDEDGKRMAVILPIERYERLLEAFHDLSVIVARRDEEPVSLDEMKRRLMRDGLL